MNNESAMTTGQALGDALRQDPGKSEVPTDNHNLPVSEPCSDSEKNTESEVSSSWRPWLVVFAGAITAFVYQGVIYTWGILQIRLLETTSSSLTVLMFVGSLGASFMVSMAIISGMSIRKYGYRRTALAGALMMGLGEFLASWVTEHVAALFVFHSIIFGMGGGLSIYSCASIGLRCHDKHRGLAVGIVFAGGSLGAAVMSIASNLLVKDVDVAWTFRIWGLMLWAVCVPASYLIHPPQQDNSPKAKLEIQWYRWREMKFWALNVGTAISCFPLFIPPYFIPIFCRSMGFSDDTAVFTLAGWNLMSTVGRVAGGYLADSVLGPINSVVLCLALIALSSLVIWPFSYGIGVFIVFIVINGASVGAYYSLVPPMVGAAFGHENTLGIIPIMYATWFCGIFFGTPIASSLYTLTGGAEGINRYRPAAYYAGGVSVLGLAFIIALRFSQTRRIWVKI